MPVTYSAIAGRGCTSASASYDEYGFYTNGDAGWWTVGAGSWTGSGCNGEFTDMPMSGNAGADSDSGQAMIWGFKVGPRAQSCALKFYVPTSASARDVAASAAHVVVVHGTGLGNTAYVNPNGEHWMDQRSHHRSWLSLGTYPVHNGTIGVKLTNRGDPNGYPETFPHLAGGAVQIRCVAE